ncbi:MAG: DUF5664 domain-containing protein [Deltaproteobacteria bacterium]|nr:DUF5664 domain-containing protein [Deltaproteobacteria bacterium]
MSVGIKDDNGKSRLDLIAPGALLEMGQVLAHGAEKYSEDNWKKVENGQDRYYAAAMRHLLAWRQGEKLDPESGLTHLAHAMTNLMFLHALDASPVAVLGRPDESKPTEAEYVQLTWTNRDRRWKPE